MQRLFVIGAQRSGSSWLAETLHAHPEVTMRRPPRPEPKSYLAGPPDRRGLETIERDLAGRSGPSTRVWGEKSTSYIEHPEVADHVQAVHPTARFLAVLRDPLERALSNHRFSVQHGFEDRPADVALDPDAWLPAAPSHVSVSPYDYLGRSRYVEHLEPWAARVSWDRLLVVLLDDLLRGQGMAEVQRFLGLSSPLQPPSRVVNASVAGDDEIGDDLRLRLDAHFAPFNDRLEALLGRSLPWGRHGA